TFCGSCNRLRITATGDIITCLYASKFSNIRDMIRQHPKDDKALVDEIKWAISKRAKTGIEAEKLNTHNPKSMTSIGG
ncbi:MAG: cyclic pyranopterin phosphate synthase MoaA, partial [Flavobacteriaceae bacterium]|nr:cyclic pyranopterin phosphate synthase MoaA [Flavobacteriaceae bacterium]